MKVSNSPHAFPYFVELHNPNLQVHTGLTKREYAAIKLLAAMLSSFDTQQELTRLAGEADMLPYAARLATEGADVLLAALAIDGGDGHE